MKEFNIGIKELKEALFYLGFGVSERTHLPVTKSTLIQVMSNRIIFTTTNTELTIVHEIVRENEFEFKVLIPFSELKNIAATCSSDLTISVIDNKILIEHGKDKFNLNIIDEVQDFPKTPEANLEKAIQLPEGFSKSVGLAILSSKPHDEEGLVIENILVELSENKIIVTATDKQILYSKEFVSDYSGKNRIAFITKSAANIIKNIPDLDIQFGGDVICFRTTNTTIFINQPTSRYPDWTAIIPKEFSGELFIKTNSLIDLTNRGMMFGYKYPIAKLTLSDKLLTATTKVLEQENYIDAEMDIESSWQGEMGLSLDCLKKVLSQASSDWLRIKITGNNSPLQIIDGDDTSTTILMMTVSP